MMEEQGKEPADGHGQPIEPKRNTGKFRKGDRRINREGRPRGSKAGSQEGNRQAPGYRCRRTDRLMLLFVPWRNLAWRFRNKIAPWMVNLPPDIEIVGSRADGTRKGDVYFIRSQTFPRIAQGALVPELRPEFNGLRWAPRWPS
jgi:hypothetical protein